MGFVPAFTCVDVVGMGFPCRRTPLHVCAYAWLHVLDWLRLPFISFLHAFVSFRFAFLSLHSSFSCSLYFAVRVSFSSPSSFVANPYIVHPLAITSSISAKEIHAACYER